MRETDIELDVPGIDLGLSPYERLRDATEMGKAGDGKLALRLVFASGYPVTLARRLHADYPKLEFEVAEDAVAEGLFSFFKACKEFRLTTSAPAYILKTARRCMNSEVVRRQGQQSYDEVDDADLARAGETDGDQDIRAALRQEALGIARSMLPRIGLDNVQSVMSLILDAVDNEAFIDNREIAQALDLSDEVVRQCKSRGFKRLARLARDEGFNLRFLGDADEDEEE